MLCINIVILGKNKHLFLVFIHFTTTMTSQKCQGLISNNFFLKKIIFYILASLTAFCLNGQTSLNLEKIKANGYVYNCRTAGDSTAQKCVVLLHGFPETSHMWIPVMKELVKEGYYCIAPDMRGYSPQARPKGIKNYAIDILAKDIIDIAAAKKIDTFHLIGHDWGAAVGWAVCGLYPSNVRSFVALSVPHLTALSQALKSDKSQRKMSAYARLFQLPVWPEVILKAKDMKQLKTACWYLSDSAQTNAYCSVFGQKNALKSCLHYYRKNWNKMAQIAKSLKMDGMTIPTTFIWGNKDSAIGTTAAYNCEKYLKGPYHFENIDASHWLIQEKEKTIVALCKQHLQQYD